MWATPRLASLVVAAAAAAGAALALARLASLILLGGLGRQHGLAPALLLVVSPHAAGPLFL